MTSLELVGHNYLVFAVAANGPISPVNCKMLTELCCVKTNQNFDIEAGYEAGRSIRAPDFGVALYRLHYASDGLIRYEFSPASKKVKLVKEC